MFESELGAFVATIPWNFYAIFSLLLVFFLCCTDFDFGPMRRAEEQASRQSVDVTASGGTADEKLKYNPNGTTWDMLVPLGALIVFAVLALMYTGGYWGTDAKYHTFMAAIGNSSASISLVFASFGALMVALLMYVPRKLMTFAQFAEGSVEGMKLMLPANIILILAWTLSGVCRDLLSAPQFMQHVVTSSGMGAMFLPVIVFAIAAFLAFSMGTAWGTFGILIPIVVPLGLRRSLLSDFGYDDSVVSGRRLCAHRTRFDAIAVCIAGCRFGRRWLLGGRRLGRQSVDELACNGGGVVRRDNFPACQRGTLCV